jgi:hypothetical protein
LEIRGSHACWTVPLCESACSRLREHPTADHPFWNATDEAWQQAEDLDVGDYVLSADGRTIVVGGLHESTAFTGTAFNLTVDDIHTYFVRVGNSEVLVHNTGCDWPVQVGGNCSACAAEIQQTLGGGDIMRLQPTQGQALGPSVNNPGGNWAFHDVVVKDGLVFDSFTGPAGLPIDAYLAQFEYADAIALVAP